MGKPKQQVLSRFFSPKPAPSSAAPDPAPPPNPKPAAAHPPVSTVASFSPTKRARALSLSPKSPATKRPKPSAPTRDAVHRKLLEPLHPPPPSRPLNPSAGGGKGYTPLEQQVVDLKARHPDVLLMVEVGYRFRFFGEDAAVAAAVFGIVAHPDRSFLTASVPTFRLGFHVRHLVSVGHKVGARPARRSRGGSRRCTRAPRSRPRPASWRVAPRLRRGAGTSCASWTRRCRGRGGRGSK